MPNLSGCFIISFSKLSPAVVWLPKCYNLSTNFTYSPERGVSNTSWFLILENYFVSAICQSWNNSNNVTIIWRWAKVWSRVLLLEDKKWISGAKKIKRPALQTVQLTPINFPSVTWIRWRIEKNNEAEIDFTPGEFDLDKLFGTNPKQRITNWNMSTYSTMCYILPFISR